MPFTERRTIMEELNAILNAEEVANYLRISKRTLLKEVNEGKIKAFKAGKSLRFTRVSIEEYMKNQEVKPGEALEDTEEVA
jgi:excisionase family DNA binding protein